MGWLDRVSAVCSAITGSSSDDDDYDDDDYDDDDYAFSDDINDDDDSYGVGRMAVPIDQRDPRPNFYPRERREVRERDGELCDRCGQPTDEDNWHCDHHIAWSHGGRTDVDNGRVTHPECNWEKSDDCVPECEDGQNMTNTEGAH